jgi:tubulin monoglycylase TTLL3/8
LEEVGWSENEEMESLMYDLKFMSKKKNIDYVNLQDFQYINHFQENKAITAKFGLARNIRNLATLAKDSTAFFPRCFDMNDVAELEDFYEDFKFTQIKSFLFKFIAN